MPDRNPPFHKLTNFGMVQEFNRAMDVEHSASFPNRELRWSLIYEEMDEVFTELFPGDGEKINRPRLAKELADLLYVVYGCADALDIPIDEVFYDVHQSNMSKLGADGRPIRREDGKVMKGPNYKPPDLSYVA